MEEHLIRFIEQLVSLSDEEKKVICEHASHRKLKKREIFIRAGKICDKILFFSNGYFRFFHLDYQGNEITSDFYFAPNFISSYTSLITGKPSFVNVQAMSDMDVLEFDKVDLYALYSRYPRLERLGRLAAELVTINAETHLFTLLNQPAEVRYKTFFERNPSYVNIIPLQYIASYLGISKETLSRMRKNIV